MLVYPQLTTGAVSQFPVTKRRHLRTVVNRAADGSTVKFADPNGEYTEWILSYSQLSDSEISALEQFFIAAEGTLNSFTFLDPTANLLAWSDRLDNPVWAVGPALTIAGAAADPMGGANAWQVSNAGAGAQSFVQTIPAPGGYLYCLSLYLRCASTSIVTLLLGSQRSPCAVTPSWSRFVFAAAGDAQSETSSF